MSKGSGDESNLKKLEAYDIKNRHDLYASIADDYITHRNNDTPEKSFIFQRRFPRGEYVNPPVYSRRTNSWIINWFGKRGIMMSDIDGETDKSVKSADKGGRQREQREDIKPKDTAKADKDQVALLYSFLKHLESQGMPGDGNGEVSSDAACSAGIGEYYGGALAERLKAASDLYYFLNCEDEEGTDPSIREIRNKFRFNATSCFLPVCFDALSGAGLYIIGHSNLDDDMDVIDRFEEENGKLIPKLIKWEETGHKCFACILWTKFKWDSFIKSFIKNENGYEGESVQCIEIYTQLELALTMFNYYKENNVFLKEYRKLFSSGDSNKEISDDERDYMNWLGSNYPAFRPYYPPVSAGQSSGKGIKAEENELKAMEMERHSQVPGAKEPAVPKIAGLPEQKTRIRSKRRK